MSDDELQHLVSEIEDYRKKMEKAEGQMKSSMSAWAFMTAHLATMEVAGEVKYSEKYNCKCICMCKYIWIFYILKYYTLWNMSYCSFLYIVEAWTSNGKEEWKFKQKDKGNITVEDNPKEKADAI